MAKATIIPMGSTESVETNLDSTEVNSREKLKDSQSNEVFIALVGPVGSGTSYVADTLNRILLDNGVKNTQIFKASDLILKVAKERNIQISEFSDENKHERVSELQDLGDEIRLGKKFNRVENHSAVISIFFREITQIRNEQKNKNDERELNEKRVYIIDSLRHYEEARVLREVYGDSFFLLGIVSYEEMRKKWLFKKYFDENEENKEEKDNIILEILNRDADDELEHGQHVSDTFHLADYFVNNSISNDSEAYNDPVIPGNLINHLNRFVDLILQNKVLRPTIFETAMHHAHSAQLRSACISRQVGAALVNKSGNIIATGTNDVPKSGGGLYGEELDKMNVNEEFKGGRCVFFGQFCRNYDEQDKLIEELIENFPELTSRDKNKKDVKKKIKSLRIGSLLEFSRAVHAELHAILSAAEAGNSTKDCKMCVTTFPCHYCARHIVASGINEVRFIEPYPKSLALELHSDSISMDPTDCENKVIFHPFVGVAPNLYRRVFLKERSLKNKSTGKYELGVPKWRTQQQIYELSYKDLEEKLAWR